MKIIYTEKLVENVIEGCDADGDIYGYFADYQRSEKELRDSFKDPLKNKMDVENRLRILNATYNTRYKKVNIPALGGIIFKNLDQQNYLKSHPPKLSTGSRVQFSKLITQILGNSYDAGLDRPYSLVTKFHHFSFPDSFVMYDQWVARSIQMWAYFSFEDRGKEYENFTYDRIEDHSGSGYKVILDFYINLFENARSGMAQLEALSKKLAEEFSFKITSLDLVDKFLWNCEGDPKYLGFLD